MVSFQEGSQLLRELAGIGIDASQVERGAEALGDEIAADERLHSGPQWGKSRCLPPFPLVSTVSVFRGEPRNWPGEPANNLTVPRKRGRLRSAPSGVLKRAT